MRLRTDKLSTVSGLVFLEVGTHIPMFHPLGYDAKHDPINHLDSLDCHDVLVSDMFGNQHLLTKVLEVS